MNAYVFRHGLAIGIGTDKELKDPETTKKQLKGVLLTDVAVDLFELESLHDTRGRLLKMKNKEVGDLFIAGSVSEALQLAGEHDIDYDEVFDQSDELVRGQATEEYRRKKPNILIEHSPVKRCIQTAALLLEVVSELGGTSQIEENEGLHEYSVTPPVELLAVDEDRNEFDARFLVTHYPIIDKIQSHLWFSTSVVPTRIVYTGGY